MNRIVLIGNGTYEKHSQINSVYEDIDTMERIFSMLGYEVIKYIDWTYNEIKNELEKFKEAISDKDTIIVYYSGHGFHKNGRNFILTKDSPSLPDAKVNSEYYDGIKFLDVQNFTQLAQHNLYGNTLVIVDACRIEDSVEFEPLKEAIANTNIAWQLFSTSIGKYAYGDGVFVQAIEHAIYRYQQGITEFYESICCYMENNCTSEQYRVPILISGKNNFSITNYFNEKLEEQYYKDLINIYLQVRAEIEGYDYPYTEDTVTKIATEINPFLNFPLDKMKENIRKILRYDNNLGIIDLLIDENLKSIDVFTDRFFLHGRFSNYYFPCIVEKQTLYEFNSCWSYILAKSNCTSDFIYKYGKITCINVGVCATEPCFSLVINKSESDLTYYIDDYYQDDINKIKKLHISLRNIFVNKNSILISSAIQINALSFIYGLLYKYLQHSANVCELVNLTQLESTPFFCEKFQFEQLLSDADAFQEFRRKMKDGRFDWIIIPLTAYHDCGFSEFEMNRLTEIESIAKENRISFIFYTDFLEEAVPTMHITKQALPLVSYTVNLKFDEFNKHTYIESIKEMENA